MMATHWIVDIMLVMILIPAQEFGGTVTIKIEFKLVIEQNGFILDRVTQTRDIRLNRCITYCLYQNKPSEKYSSIFSFNNFPTCPRSII